MASKSIFVCQNCGHESIQWLGRCPACKEFTTFSEEITQEKSKNIFTKSLKKNKHPNLINDIKSPNYKKLSTHDHELNRVLDEGIVPGSIILLAGDPGIGKSTLLLQLAIQGSIKTLYISGEESESQIKLRADRIGVENKNCFILNETLLENIFSYLNNQNNHHQIIIIDSIQTLYSNELSSPIGSVSQIRECCSRLLQFAKDTNITVVMIGHITKDGQIAGPKILEHMVDVVLHFEGDKNFQYRILRSKKNRFGSISEIGIYEMGAKGLFSVKTPSKILLSENYKNLDGCSISCVMDGDRSFLVEVQALVSTAVYGTPQRTANGFNLKRLNMLLAVLEKKCGFKLGKKDVFLNIIGGIKVSDPALDLSVVASILSSSIDLPILKNSCFIGEIGLNGEVRPEQTIEKRISEVEKMGFSNVFISAINKLSKKARSLNIIKVATIDDLKKSLFDS